MSEKAELTEAIEIVEKMRDEWASRIGIDKFDRRVIAKRVAALSTLIKHVEDTERMLYGLATADFDGDWCITRFNCQYRATKYDEDGTTLKESRYYQDPLSAFLALEEKK
jgi:hypothetical protein